MGASPLHASFEEIVRAFDAEEREDLLLDGRWGLEKESQRGTSTGDLALTGHPAAFGSKTGNPYITTDFSESQIEMITPPFPTIEETYAFLERTQEKVLAELGSELLWPLSMPPRLPAEEDIPIAAFDDTPDGRVNEIYRQGLALRHGKKMQMISGLHYNFSFGDGMIQYLYGRYANGEDKKEFVNGLYAAVARNFLRYRWLLIYLMGASPSADATYRSEIVREVETVLRCCPACCDIEREYRRFATSLRVSRFGYSNSIQRNFIVSFDSVKAHIRDLRRLLATKSSEYERLGLFENGRRLQLNVNVLQKESEFYSPIRFKQTIQPGEAQLDALERRGVQYLEVRILDLNPFEKIGISLTQLRFLQAFMLFCLFEPSPPITEREWEAINGNHHLVALSGRKPGLTLLTHGLDSVSLRDWGLDIVNRLEGIAGLMDRSRRGSYYRNAVQNASGLLRDPSQVPSARIQREMERRHDDHIGFGLRWSQRNEMNPLADIADIEEVDQNGINRKHQWAGAFHPGIDQGGAETGSGCQRFGPG